LIEGIEIAIRSRGIEDRKVAIGKRSQCQCVVTGVVTGVVIGVVIGAALGLNEPSALIFSGWQAPSAFALRRAAVPVSRPDP
jgi:hypothetical protein